MIHLTLITMEANNKVNKIANFVVTLVKSFVSKFFSRKKLPLSKKISNDTLITRNSWLTRFVHWTHLIIFFLLTITGLVIYFPFLALPFGGLAGSMLLHRIFGIIYVIIPFYIIATNYNKFIYYLSDYSNWQAKDMAWLIKFPAYIFFPKKIKMPEFIGKINPGQKILGSAMITCSFLMAISGLIRMLFYPFPTSITAVAYTVHQVIFPLLILLFLGHVFIGSGILPIYRGVARSIFRDGKLKAGFIKIHWKNWLDHGPRSSPSKGRKVLLTLVLISFLIYSSLFFISYPDIKPTDKPAFDEENLSAGTYRDYLGRTKYGDEIILEIDQHGSINYIIKDDSIIPIKSWEAKNILINYLVRK